MHARILIAIATIAGMAGTPPLPPVSLFVDSSILVLGVNAICD
jgi:hypothetical protein